MNDSTYDHELLINRCEFPDHKAATGLSEGHKLHTTCVNHSPSLPPSLPPSFLSTSRILRISCSFFHLSFHLQYHTSNPLSIHPSAYNYMYLHSVRKNAQLKQKLQDMVQEHTQQVCNLEYTTKASVMPYFVSLEPRRKQP